MAGMKAALFNNKVDLENPDNVVAKVFGQGRLEQLRGMVDLYPEVVSKTTFADHADALKDIEVIFSTWGMPDLDADAIARMPNLKAVFYAAGTVQGFARPFLDAGVQIFSAWAANAIPVAEFCVAQIILAFKHVFRNVQDCKDKDVRLNWKVRPVGKGMFGETVAFLGYGQVCRKTIELLAPYRITKLVVDPYLSDADAKAAGLEKVTLEEAFARAYVVSNHIANLPTTKGMIEGRHFESMRTDATFLNTGRGAQVKEAEMCEVLARRPDLTAILDVTDPEPPVAESPLYDLPNVVMTSHIAGSSGDEVVRMADYMLEEFGCWSRGEPLHYEVTLPMLETMA